MHELGAVIREAREANGMTLEELNKRTKIRIRYLQAIEEGKLEILPGEVYYKGFVRSIARELGLDYQELMDKYYRPLFQEDVQAETVANIPEQENESPVQKTAWGRLLLIVLSAILVLSLVLFVAFKGVWQESQDLDENEQHTDGTQQQDSEHPSQSDPTEEPDEGNSPKTPENEPKAVLITAESSNSNRYIQVNAEQAEVVVSVPTSGSEDCWVGYRANSQQDWTDTTLRPGESQRLVFTSNIELRFGNPRAVTVAINGIEFAPGKYGNEDVDKPVSFYLLIEP